MSSEDQFPTIEIAGYSDDIVYLKDAVMADEHYYQDGDTILIRAAYTSGGYDIVVEPTFGEFGWSFKLRLPKGSTAHYRAVDANV